MLHRILMIGDVVGQAGKRALFFNLASYRKEQKIDLCIVNAENADEGFGITTAIANELFSCGADIITTGNHVWQREEVYPFLDSCDRLLRPHNYPSPAPGKGYTFLTVKGIKMAVINLQGRVRMSHIVDCPFKVGLTLIKKVRSETPYIFVDFHAEDTAEREALALYFDGQITALVGTHTHVPTADETILPKGTAHIGDLGMCGARHSVIGSKPSISIERSLTQMPLRIESADGPSFFSGVIITANSKGLAEHIEPVNVNC